MRALIALGALALAAPLHAEPSNTARFESLYGNERHCDTADNIAMQLDRSGYHFVSRDANFKEVWTNGKYVQVIALGRWEGCVLSRRPVKRSR
jgi:hypothetical protein